MDLLPGLVGIILVAIIITALRRDARPRRGSYVVPPLEGRPVLPPHITAPAAPLFHSKYCAGRYGSPCNCKGPHA